MINTSILITTHKRNALLRWNLESMSHQNAVGTEVIVLDDSFNKDLECEKMCRSFLGHLNIRYIHTGGSKAQDAWRIPGYAFNIGAKLARGPVLILSCGEMYHINNTIELLSSAVIEDNLSIAIPRGGYDRQAQFLQFIENRYNKHAIFINRLPKTDMELFNSLEVLNSKLPFLIAISRELFFKIGGYDEDFTGQSFDDGDLVHRLQMAGGKYKNTDAKTVHLWHETSGTIHNPAGHAHNRKLKDERAHIMVRNANREWGQLNKQKIKFFKIFCERRSGSNYLAELIVRNFGLINLGEHWDTPMGWKHGFIDHQEITDDPCRENTLAIVLYKDPLSWIYSMSKFSPHMLFMNKLSLDQFLTVQWNETNISKMDNLVRGTPKILKKYNNIFDLRYQKLKSHLSIDRVDINSLIVKYEDLLLDYSSICKKVEDVVQSGKSDFINIAKNIGPGPVEYKSRSFTELAKLYGEQKWVDTYSPNTIKIIRDNLDLDFELSLGYDLKWIDEYDRNS